MWARISTPDGVNDEFKPLFRMTFPADIASLDPENVPLGERICRSWILLFGLVPIDYDDLTLVRVEAGRGFLERSKMLSQHVWEHERTLADHPGGCQVTDRVRFEPKLRLTSGPSRFVYRLVFRYRHRRLLRRFGAP